MDKDWIFKRQRIWGGLLGIANFSSALTTALVPCICHVVSQDRTM